MTWKTVRIADLGRVVTGNTPPKKNPEFYGDDYPFIKPTDMRIGERYTPVTEENYSNLAFEKYKKSLIPPLSTCVVTIGSIGKKITLTSEQCFVNQAVNVIIPSTKYNPYFVFYAVKNILQKVKKADTGASSGRENVSKSNFMSLTLQVPESIEQQNTVASLLGSFDDLIENNQRRIDLLEQAAQNIYKEWFVKMRFPGHEETTIDQVTGIPEDWRFGRISEFGSVITGKTPSKKKVEYYGGDIPFIKTPDMHNAPYVIESKEKLTQQGVDSQSNKILPKNTVMVSCIGTAGVVAITSTLSQTNQQINSVVFDTDFKTFYFYCFAKGLKDLLNGLGSNGATMVNVNKGKFENIQLLIPSDNSLKRFNTIVKPIFSQILTLLEMNTKLITSRDILLPRLMNQTIKV